MVIDIGISITEKSIILYEMDVESFIVNEI